jgi:DNA-binding transcriptional regulator YdaS (Cro superfamily)
MFSGLPPKADSSTGRFQSTVEIIFHTLARATGVSHQAVLKWDRVPPARVLAVEELTGIARSTLRPDIYPPEREQRARAVKKG